MSSEAGFGRRAALAGVAAALPRSAAAQQQGAPSYLARVTVSAKASGRPVNRLILGSNVQWVDRGDELVTADGRLRPEMLAAVRRLEPTVLRFPGGSQSDLYRWRDGVGAARGRGTHFFSNAAQPMTFGTDEFLDLCATLDAVPLLTVNVPTASAEEAAEWVRHVGQRAHRPAIWQIGNEPYLRDERQPRTHLAPAAWAARADAAIAAMRRVTPGLTIGIPLRSDRIGGQPATPYPGFNRIVLGSLQQPFDYVAVHNAYAPFTMNRRYGERDLFLATVAAVEQIAEDFVETREQQRAARRPVKPIALTEWSAAFSIAGADDDRIISQAGALFAADLLRLLATEPDILCANHWSLSGNWHFGAIDRSGQLRPVGAVLAAYARLLRGTVLMTMTQAPSFATPQVGFVAARQAVAALTALACRHNGRVGVALVNRHPDASADVTLDLNGTAVRQATGQLLGGAGLFAGRGRPAQPWRPLGTSPSGGTEPRFTVPPHSVALLHVDV
jgi:alpha-N-arabinofuranosidase